MQVISALRCGLGILGNHASKVLPLGVITGLVMPSWAAGLQPLLVPALLVPLTLSLVRIETAQLRQSLSLWRWVVLLCVWALALRPATVLAVLQLFALPESIEKAAIITAAAPPVTACAAIAIFLRLDAALVIVSTVATMLLVPFSLPPVAHYLARLQIEADLVTLSLRLATFIFLAFCIAAVIKRVMGRDRIIKSAREIDGISVLCIGIFIVAIMHGVTDTAMEQPWFVFQVFTASSLLVFGLYVVSTAIFWRLGARSAMAVGLVCGNCNMGLMYLVLAGQASLDVLIFFAIGQVPMYFLPALLSPLVDRVLHKRC